ncbi:MAG TPA: PEP-CTERM sorting domain-containing protein [Armatimonadota bacterium]|jgi:hypothetical protein
MARCSACRLLTVALLAALVPSSAHAQIVLLDQTYVGSFYVHPFIPFTASYSAAGKGAGAANGLARIQLFDEGDIGWKDGVPNWYETDLSANSFVLRGDGEDSLSGNRFGRGFLPDLDGTFFIKEGSGRFAGYRGSGSITIRAADWSAPATMTIHGTASAVPEPSVLALLAGAAVLGIYPARRRRNFRAR